MQLPFEVELRKEYEMEIEVEGDPFNLLVLLESSDDSEIFYYV